MIIIDWILSQLWQSISVDQFGYTEIYIDSCDKLTSWTSAAAMQGVDEEAHRPSKGGAWQRRF